MDGETHIRTPNKPGQESFENDNKYTTPSYGRRSGTSLEELVLESHLRLGLEADTGAEDVGHGLALLAEGVDDGRAGRRHGCFEHVAQDAEHRVEALVLIRGGAVRGDGPPLYAGHELGDEAEVDDQRRGEEGVLADVEEPVMFCVSNASRRLRKSRATYEMVCLPPMKISA